MQPLLIEIPKCEPGPEFMAPAIGSYGGDYCYAAPFLVRAAILSNVVCLNLSAQSEQSGRQIINILKNFGALVKRSGDSVQVLKSRLTGASVDVGECERLATCAAVLALFAKGKSCILGFEKNQQLLLSLCANLKNLGVRCEAGSDRLWIWRTERLCDGLVSTGDNIYMAMGFIMLSSITDKNISVRASGALLKRYPGFLKQFGLK